MSVELSAAADRDLTDLYLFLCRQFGTKKAEVYLLSLDNCFQRLVEQPSIGVPADHLRPGYYRMEHAGHTVCYTRTDDGIRVVRVLRAQHDPERRRGRARFR